MVNQVRARYSLADVFDAIDRERVWFSARSRSVWAVMKVFEASGTPMSEIEARQFIYAGIKLLRTTDFVKSVLQWEDPTCVADVYTKFLVGRAWYIKFRIDEDGMLDEISFHLPERALRLVKE